VLGNLDLGSGAKLSAGLVADLTASIPRDVVRSAHQEWLPNLATEMANRQGKDGQERGGWGAITTGSTGSSPPGVAPGTNAREGAAGEADTAKAEPDTETSPSASGARSGGSDSSGEPDDPDSGQSDSAAGAQAAERKAASKVKLDPPPCMMSFFGQCLMSKTPENDGAAETGAANATASDGKKTPSAVELPGMMRAGAAGSGKVAEPKAAGQTDDLLSPTEEELRAMKASNPNAGGAASPEAATGASQPDAAAPPAVAAAEPRPAAVPVISIASDIDPESWADYGGWYRQDFAIYYRPTGHKDKLIYSWLFLTGPQAPKGDKSPAAAVFDYLTSKDAQGSCTKCHSVDGIPGKGRLVNFSPASAAIKRGRFTSFLHEPHFRITEERGCLTCHNLDKDRPGGAAQTLAPAGAPSDGAEPVEGASTASPAAKDPAAAPSDPAAVDKDDAKAVSPYLESYRQSNPRSFVSNFGEVKKDLCQSCHTSSMARQDCLLCHKYHVNGVATPITGTKIPAQ
jgi:hypothetical protein